MPTPSVRELERRVAGLRGRIVASRVLEDLQPGLAAGAGAALLLGLLRWVDWVPATPGLATSVGVSVALCFPLAGLLLRRLSDARVAAMVDERLGLAERVATALSLERGATAATPLAPLVSEDAVRSLAAAPPGSLRRAFLPRTDWRPLAGAAAALLAAALLFRAEPIKAEAERKPTDLAAAYRDKKEREEAQKAARRVMEEARTVEEQATRQQVQLKALAAEIRRQSEELLRQNPAPAKAMAGLQKMGEVARERAELLAGVDPKKLEEWKADGKLAKADPALDKLLQKLLSSDLKGLNADLAALDKALKGMDGSKEWSSEDLQALKEKLEALRTRWRSRGRRWRGAAGSRRGSRSSATRNSCGRSRSVSPN